jgi:hypothetical protein
VRRTLVLLAFVLLGLGLVWMVEPPRRRSGPETVRGPRPFRIGPGDIQRIEVTMGSRSFVAERVADGWRLDGAPPSAAGHDAIATLADELARLRAIDAFRPSSFEGFGLDPPRGTIVVTTPRGVQRLALGTLNAGGSAVYARRAGHARVLQLGVYLLEVVRRVPESRVLDAERARAYWPEIG